MQNGLAISAKQQHHFNNFLQRRIRKIELQKIKYQKNVLQFKVSYLTPITIITINFNVDAACGV